jgi:hypothetical protein
VGDEIRISKFIAPFGGWPEYEAFILFQAIHHI